jgi:chemotaxis protein MotD
VVDTPVVPNGTIKDATKDQSKAIDQVLVQVGANHVDAIANDAKSGVKSSVKSKGDAVDADTNTDAAPTSKDASVGVQDALSMLAQTAVTQAAAATSQATAAGDGTLRSTAGDKIKDGLDAKVKVSDVGKTASAATTLSTSSTQQAASNSAADALHMVSAGDHKIGSSAEEKLTVADSSTLTNSDKLQGVDVLDSRRIIAPASTSNGANIAATMTGDSDWSTVMRSYSSSDVSDADKLTTDKTLNTLTIKMTPESLGTVTASLKLVDGQLSVSLVVESASAYRKLHEDRGDLLTSLKAQGFGVDQIQISIASPDKSTNDASQNQAGQQNQAQQNSSGQNQGSNRQQAQVPFENYGQTSGGLVDDAASTVAPGAGNSSGGAGGQLYL